MADLPLKYRPFYKELRSSHKHMKYRCENPASPKYHRYGGRGIKVCDRWKKFENFYDDMVETYSRGLTLNRINNNKGYYPKNCEWATQKQQANNRSTNTLATINGVTKTIQQWSESLGINHQTIHQRINAYGWSVEDAIVRRVRS